MCHLLLSDPAVAAVPVRESHEPLIDIRTVPALRLGRQLAVAPGQGPRLRLDALDRLVCAQTLLPAGLRLLILAGHRSGSVRERSGWPRLSSAALAHSSAPRQVGAHVSGGGVDVTLCVADGAAVWMGSVAGDTDDRSCALRSAALGPEERLRRQFLAEVLGEVGFVNDPRAWWHWSYGDKFWASATDADHAKYGAV